MLQYSNKNLYHITGLFLNSEKIIFNAINKVIELVSPINTKITNLKIIKHINDKGYYFCINSNIKVFMYDKIINQ